MSQKQFLTTVSCQNGHSKNIENFIGVKAVAVTPMTTIDQTKWYQNWVILGTTFGLSTLTTLTTNVVTTIKLFW